jgi:histidinol-phosphate aminotransferase
MRTDKDVVKPAAGAGNISGLASAEKLHAERNLAQKLISKLSRYANLPEDHISMLSSPDRAFDVLLSAFCGTGDEILVCGPVQNHTQESALRRNADVQFHYSYSPFSADSRGIEKKLRAKTKIIFLENPNHSTGTVYSRSELTYLLEHAGGAVVALDESYSDYIGTTITDLVDEYSNLVVVRRFPVLAGPDVEPIGLVMAGRETMQRIRMIAQGSTPTISQLTAAIAVLNNIQDVKGYIEAVRENIIYLSVKLRSLGVSCRVSPVDFLLVKVVNPQIVAASLRGEGLVVQEVHHLPQLEDYVSVTVGDDSSSARIVEAFEKMPVHYYMLKKFGRGRVTLHRRPEDRVSQDDEKEEKETDVTVGGQS